MSFTAAMWARSLKLPSTEKYVLLMVALRGDKNNLCYSPVTQICSDTGLDRKTVEKNLRILRTKKYINDTGKRTGKTNRVPVYRLSVEQKKYNFEPNKYPQIRGHSMNVMPPKLGVFKNYNTPKFPHQYPQIGGYYSINKINNIINNIEMSILKKPTIQKKPKIKESKNKTLVLKTFKPTQRHYELSDKNGWPNPDHEVESFIDYYLSTRKKYYDWDLTFNNWLRKAKEFKKDTTRHAGAKKTHSEKFWGSIPREHYPDFSRTDSESG